MRLAFCLYQYFPHGGMERIFLRTALLCRKRGHRVRVYAWHWTGPRPEGLEIIDVPVHARRRLRLYRCYWDWVRRHLQEHPVECSIGFNRGPWLDLCYDADGCYAEKIRIHHSPLYRLGARCRYFLREERALFSGHCRVLTTTRQNIVNYRKHYAIAEDAIHLLPPGIEPKYHRPPNAATVRQEFRREHGMDAQTPVLLMIGSDYTRKGLSRSLRALAALPPHLGKNAQLFVLGRGRPGPFLRLARRLGVARRLHLLGARDDTPRFLFGADLLLHPARYENSGTVILEAVVAGLPVIASGACGHAPRLREAGAGIVLAEPFSQREFNARLAEILGLPETLRRYREHGLRYAREQDLYSRIERIAEIIEAGGWSK